MLRWSNLFSNAGRIPFIKVIAGGFGVLEVVRCFGRVFGRSRWWRLTMLVAAADGWASNKQDAAGMPLRLPPAQPSPGSHQSRLLPKTHPACIAQVCLAGSTTIDEEVTDYFKDTGWGALLRHS